MKEHFNKILVGDCNLWKVTVDEVNFHVYTMKDPDYVMASMSTYGTNLQSGKEPW